MIRKLAHLNFVTNDLEKIIDFYVNKLGLKVKFTLDNQEAKPFGYYFACGDTTFLEFFDQAMAAEVWGGKVEELNIGTRYKHFCLEVTGLDEFCRMLRDKGVDVTEIKLGMDNSRQAWIADPDGNSIELMEYGYSSMQLSGERMYTPNPQSEFRVKFDFRVDFTNGGYVEGREFLLDLEGDTISDEDLKVMIVESMNLAKAGEVQIFKRKWSGVASIRTRLDESKRSTERCSAL